MSTSTMLSEETLSFGLLEGSMAQLHISSSDSDTISLSSLFESDDDSEPELPDGSDYEREEDAGIISHLAHSTLTNFEIVEWQRRMVAELTSLEAGVNLHRSQATAQFQAGIDRIIPSIRTFQSDPVVPKPHVDCWIGLSFGCPYTGVFLRRFGMISGKIAPHISSQYTEFEIPETFRYSREPLGSLNVSAEPSDTLGEDAHYIPEMDRRSALFYPNTQILVPA